MNVASAAELDALRGLRCITGTLQIEGSGISDLGALSELDTVCGSVVISGAVDLGSLVGLEALRQIGDALRLTYDPVEDLSPLANLVYLRRLELLGLEVVDLSGLEGLSRIADGIDIRQNFSLTSLQGLENLRMIGGLAIRNNGGLLNHAELGGLEAVSGDVRLSGSSELVSVGPFPKLTTIEGELDLHDNPVLDDLEGLAALESTDSILIVNNVLLAHQDAVDLATRLDVPGRVKIDGNLDSPPHPGECPWENDGECDEPGGWSICDEGTDPIDCYDPDGTGTSS